MKMCDVIRTLRIQKGITQDELGKVIGVQGAAIRKYESGRVENIKQSSIQKLAEYFGVTPAYIMGWEDEDEQKATTQEKVYPEEPISPAMKELLQDVQNLSEEDCKQISAYVKFLMSMKK